MYQAWNLLRICPSLTPLHSDSKSCLNANCFPGGTAIASHCYMGFNAFISIEVNVPGLWVIKARELYFNSDRGATETRQHRRHWLQGKKCGERKKSEDRHWNTFSIMQVTNAWSSSANTALLELSPHTQKMLLLLRWQRRLPRRWWMGEQRQ